MPLEKLTDLDNVVEEIISSYEERVHALGSIFDTPDMVISGFQDALMDTRDEREKVNSQLRDILARNEHLRRKDFDNMTQSVLSAQQEREKEVRLLLREYFNEQKAMTRSLRENLNEFKKSLASGEVQRVREFQALIKDILQKQASRKKEITSRLRAFQREQRYLSTRPKELLAKGNELRIKDFKSMLKELKTQRQERLAVHKKRKEDVAKMLTGFKQKRRKSAKVNKVNKAVDIDRGSESISQREKR
jgi:hypothetical protein